MILPACAVPAVFSGIFIFSFQSLAFRFSAFRAVKHYPGAEAGREVFEAMLSASGHEQHVAGLERVALNAFDEPARTARDDIDLVPRMWLLRIMTCRAIHFDLQGAVLEYHSRRNTATKVLDGLKCVGNACRALVPGCCAVLFRLHESGLYVLVNWCQRKQSTV